VDLPKGVRSGLIEALDILGHVDGVGFVRMNKSDIVRHKLVTKIVEAYESTDKD
jgi:phosphate starvation-inducible PhoH-like protein